MSAWIVSKAHIDVLTQALAIEGIISWAHTDLVGRRLWRENHISVNARYGERTRTPPYHFEGVEAPFDQMTVFKAICCYTYQSCEHDKWERSQAYALMAELDERVIANLGFTDRKEAYADPRWDTGPWGIDSIKQAIA